MATYKLSYDKMKQLERIVSDYPAFKFKLISKKLYDENFKLLKEHYLNLNFGKIMLSKLTWCYGSQQASEDAHTLLVISDALSVGSFVKAIKDKDTCACSMLDSEQEKDLIDAYEIKEILYRISSYVQAKNLGYNDVLVSYSELKDIEYLISLYDDNNLEDLISKYL